ncbi:MAG: NADH-quinone oxidoreductase subunit NuoH [Anaerolineales bacterium]
MTDPITWIANWLEKILEGIGLPSGIVILILTILGVLIVVIFVLVMDIFLVWMERKVVARFQDRLGPNRVGPYGLIQPIADVIKLLIKEDTTPKGADVLVYNLAPVIALASVLVIWAVIPFAPTLVGAEINIGILFIVAFGGIGTLAIIMAGWSSNNKYALIGAFRTVAQVVSYEIPMVIALLIPVILARTMSIQGIVESQELWNIVIAPLAAAILLISSIAEIGRTPFDLLEAESEIVAGFHIEYSGMKFGLFYAGELLHALTIGALFSTLFLGGWRGPFVEQVPVLGVIYLFIKAFLVYFLIMWIRYTLPRIRIDHMLNFNWKFLTPLALIMLMVTAIMDKLLSNYSKISYAIVMLAVNIIIIWAVLLVLKSYSSFERQKVGVLRPTANPDAVLSHIVKETSPAQEATES